MIVILIIKIMAVKIMIVAQTLYSKPNTFHTPLRALQPSSVVFTFLLFLNIYSNWLI